MKYIVYDLIVFFLVTQSKINNEVQFNQALNPLKNVAEVSSIDYSSDLQNVFT